MAQAVTITDEATVAFRKFAERGAKGRIPLGRFWLDLYRRVNAEWNAIKVETGGTFRGKRWEPMKAQYTRKDGTEIPAWGGIGKVIGRGNVKGKLRTGSKGARVKSSDVLMADTKRMQQTMFGGKPQVLDDRHIEAFPDDALIYAEYQNEMREFAFFQDGVDEPKLAFFVDKYLDECAEQFNSGR